MNIKGYERLIETGLPVARYTVLFRTLQEIPTGHMDVHGDEPAWFMAGFDYENTRITDLPQVIRQVRTLNLSRKSLEERFNQLETELEKKQISKQNRKYLIWEMHTPDNTSFSGFGFKSPYEIMIDFFEGVRPSRRESNPIFSVNIPTMGLSCLPQIPESTYRNYAIRIAKDLTVLSDNTSVDFLCLKDGYLFYHDLWQLSNHK